MEEKQYPIIDQGEFYFRLETEHFVFDCYKSWDAHGQAMFRAGSYVKKFYGRKYYLDYALFAEWDYKDKQTAFENAKQWLFDYIEQLIGELSIKENL